MYGNEIKGNPGTPPHLKKYRKTGNMEPGQIMVHPGLADGRKATDYSYAFGEKNAAMRVQQPVGDVIKAQNLNGLADKFNDAKEGKYASMVKEPLGKSYQRGYNWPKQVVNAQQHAFGVPTQGLLDAKTVIYPNGGSLEEKQDTAKMYKQTHGNFAPGE